VSCSCRKTCSRVVQQDAVCFIRGLAFGRGGHAYSRRRRSGPRARLSEKLLEASVTGKHQLAQHQGSEFSQLLIFMSSKQPGPRSRIYIILRCGLDAGVLSHIFNTPAQRTRNAPNSTRLPITPISTRCRMLQSSEKSRYLDKLYMRLRIHSTAHAKNLSTQRYSSTGKTWERTPGCNCRLAIAESVAHFCDVKK
jgi:hypothetical protein